MTDKESSALPPAVIETSDSNQDWHNERLLKEFERQTSDQYLIAGDVAVAINHLQLSEFFSFTSVSRLHKIKKAKEYKDLVIQSKEGFPVTIHTWEEFCIHALGRSRSAVDEDIYNFKQLGSYGYDALRKIGINKGAITRLSRLPENNRDAVVEQVLSHLDDPDHIEVMLDGVLAKHKARTEAIKKKLAEKEADLGLKARQIEDKDRKINEYHERELAREMWPAEKVTKEALKIFSKRVNVAVSKISLVSRSGRNVREADAEYTRGQLTEADLNSGIYRIYEQLEQAVLYLGLNPEEFKLYGLENPPFFAAKAKDTSQESDELEVLESAHDEENAAQQSSGNVSQFRSSSDSKKAKS